MGATPSKLKAGALISIEAELTAALALPTEDAPEAERYDAPDKAEVAYTSCAEVDGACDFLSSLLPEQATAPKVRAALNAKADKTVNSLLNFFIKQNLLFVLSALYTIVLCPFYEFLKILFNFF